MELDHEKFEGLKELAVISQKISEGTAALIELKESEDTYLTEREAKLVGRLQTALVDSADLIKAIGRNHDALVGYRTELVGFHETILFLLQRVNNCNTNIDAAATALEEQVDGHEADVLKFREDTTRERVAIDSEHAELAAWRDELGNTERVLIDREQMLERTINRTNN